MGHALRQHSNNYLNNPQTFGSEVFGGHKSRFLKMVKALSQKKKKNGQSTRNKNTILKISHLFMLMSPLSIFFLNCFILGFVDKGFVLPQNGVGGMIEIIRCVCDMLSKIIIGNLCTN